MQHIAFLTSSQFPDLVPSDEGVATYLRAHDFEISVLIWNDPSLDIEAYDMLVIRSVWDYHLYYDEWMAFLDKLQRAKTPVLNSPAILRWNSNKKYLTEIDKAYAPVPFEVLEKGEEILLQKLMKEKGWSKVVVKPVVSASAYQTWTCSLEEVKTKQARLNDMLSEKTVIIQEFAVEVMEKGEWSLIFFDKKYSHSVLKKAKQGEFRVQRDFGGIVEAIPAPEEALAAATHILETIQIPITYARVDGIMRNGRFYLMELELIEPELFISDYPGSEALFGKAIIESLKKV